jgi:hypothetical protein
MILIVAVLALVFSFAPDVGAAWQAPVNLGANVNSVSDEFGAALSPDGLTLIFDSNRAGGFGDFDLWQSTDTGGSWGTATNLGSGVNTSARDYTPALSPDGLTLYLTSSTWNLMQSTWTGSAWSARQLVPGSVNTGFEEWAPFLAPSGTRMYFTAWNRSGGVGGHDLWASDWNGSSWGTPSVVGPNVNGSGNEYTGSVTADGLTMYLAINGDLYESQNVGSVWQTPVSLGPIVNAPNRWDTNPTISPDGTKLYFASERDGGFGGYDLYVSQSGDPTDVPGGQGQVALANRFLPPAPNPFGRQTDLRFEIRTPRHVTLQVFDVRGRVVRTLADRPYDSGRHDVTWNGRDDHGAPVSTGVYFARIRADGFEQVQRLVMLH